MRVCREQLSDRVISPQKIIGALYMGQNSSLSRVCVGEGQMQLLKSNKWERNSRKFILRMSKSGQVGISVLAVAHLSYRMNHFGIHSPPVFFCRMKLVQMLFHDSLAISLSAEQRVVSEILGPWNQIREYQSDGFVNWITDGSEPSSSAPVYRICFGKLESSMYQ